MQNLAQAKLEDAQLLIQYERYSNSYYLAGYAIELGLKACIAKTIVSETIPDKRFINDTYVHNLGNLVGVAGLKTKLKNTESKDQDFATNWALVTQWDPEVRYNMVDPYTAEITLNAITDPKSGVFKWIKTHW